ncbi:MAG: hypothetical protein FJ291_03965 [Planctomycetes bacterium]|nr:hypothetical protein [Planctomycetota bacterium]
MSLEQWVANAWLKRVRPLAQNVANLLAIGDREIGDASLEGISTDGRFTHAYDAVRALAEAALHAGGYDVPKGPQQHQRAIESLRFTALSGLPAQVDYLDRCRRMRHRTVYERMGMLQQRDAVELLEAARALREKVRDWLMSNYPELLER